MKTEYPITTKLFTHKGYDIWKDTDGFYGITKESEERTTTLCAYKYIWVVLKQKGL